MIAYENSSSFNILWTSYGIPDTKNFLPCQDKRHRKLFTTSYHLENLRTDSTQDAVQVASLQKDFFMMYNITDMN